MPRAPYEVCIDTDDCSMWTSCKTEGLSFVSLACLLMTLPVNQPAYQDTAYRPQHVSRMSLKLTSCVLSTMSMMYRLARQLHGRNRILDSASTPLFDGPKVLWLQRWAGPPRLSCVRAGLTHQ